MLIHRHPLLSFFLLANLFSWVAWAALAAAALGWTTLDVSPYLHLVGGLGPMLAAIVVTAACHGRAGLRKLVDRCIVVRGRFGSLAIAVAAPVLLFAVAAAALSGAGQGHVDLTAVGRSVEYPALHRGVYWVATILFYGFGEEVGWRGFALPRIQARRTALTSAILVSGAWAIWHLPLFAFSPGMSAMGIGGAAGWYFSLVTGSMLMTWLFNRSGGSVLVVALFHGILDILMTSPVEGPLPSFMGAAIMVWGLSIPFFLGRTNLSRRSRVADR